MKKYLYLLITGLLCATINTQIHAWEYDVENTLDKEIAVTLVLKGATQAPKSITKTIAPHKTENFNFELFNPFCVGSIIYMIDPSKYKDIDRKKLSNAVILDKYGPGALMQNYTFPEPVCKSARISIEPGSKSYEAQFVLK